MAGSDADWGGTANAGTSVTWTTTYSGGGGGVSEDESPGCNFQINDGDTAPMVAKKLKIAFNAANSPEYSASLTGANMETVDFSPAADVTGMIANAHNLSDGVPWTIVQGMTVREFHPI